MAEVVPEKVVVVALEKGADVEAPGKAVGVLVVVVVILIAERGLVE